MNKKKIILSCILSLVLCTSLIAGATFALFTSESKNNIAITSGKVEVIASIQNLELYSPAAIIKDTYEIQDATNKATTNEAKTGGEFYNKGTASYENATLTLDRMTPGDKVDFQIKITNNSNVAIKYRTIVYSINDNGLYNGLDIQIAGKDFTGNSILYPDDWTMLATNDPHPVLNCSVELPADAGNEYQGKSSQLVFIVEAVQGNTSTVEEIAAVNLNGKLTSFPTVAAAVQAINAVKDGQPQTLEIKAGTYAPLSITADNVTIKGTLGATKEESTVISTTATENIKIYGDGTTLTNLWIEAPVAQSINWLHAGVIDPYINENTGKVAKNLTVNNCHIDGQNQIQYALLYCSTGLTFTNNIVENLEIGISVMNDNTAADGFTVTGNTFINVEQPINGYWGGKPTDETQPMTISDNTVKHTSAAETIALDETTTYSYITIWDYAQNANEYSAFKNLTISENEGNIVYVLTHFDYKVKTPVSITHGTTGDQKTVYQSKVAFDISYAERENYKIVNTNGSELSKYQGNSTLTQNINGKAGVYTLAAGEYILADKVTGAEYLFEVTDPKVNDPQEIKLDTIAVFDADDLKRIAADVNDNNDTYTGKTVLLMNDIDLGGADWKPIGNVNSYPSTTFAGTFDGQGHTISNFKANAAGDGGVASAGFFGSITGKVQNLTIDNATITSTHYAGGIVGFSSANGMKITNCHVTNSTITTAPEKLTNGKWDNGDKAGGIIGYMVASDVVTGCTVTNTTVQGYRDVGGIAGYSRGTVENCKVENITLVNDRTNNYKNYTTDTEFDVNAIVGDGTAGEGNTNTGVKTGIIGAAVADQDALNDVLNNNVVVDVELPKNTEVTLPSLSGKDVTLSGDEGTVVDTTAGMPGTTGASLTFENLTINFKEGGSYGTNGFTHSEKVVYKNCTIIGTQFLYSEAEFINCTFEVEGDAYAVWTYGAKDVKFTNCTFNTSGKAILVYIEAAHTATITVKDCTFNDNGDISGKAAIEIGESAYGNKANYTIIIENSTVNGFEQNNSTSALWGNKNSMDKDHLNVTIDGVDAY